MLANALSDRLSLLYTKVLYVHQTLFFKIRDFCMTSRDIGGSGAPTLREPHDPVKSLFLNEINWLLAGPGEGGVALEAGETAGRLSAEPRGDEGRAAGAQVRFLAEQEGGGLLGLPTRRITGRESAVRRGSSNESCGGRRGLRVEDPQGGEGAATEATAREEGEGEEAVVAD